MNIFSSYFAMGLATTGIIAAGGVLYHQQTVIKQQEVKFEQIKQELQTTQQNQQTLNERSTNLEQREEVISSKEKAYEECFIIQQDVCYTSEQDYDNFRAEQEAKLNPTKYNSLGQPFE